VGMRKMSLILYVFLFLHLFFCASAATVNYSRDGDAALYAQVPDSFFVDSIEVRGDAQSKKREILISLGLCEKMHMSPKDLVNACFYLKHTYKYEQIFVSLASDNGSTILRFTLSRAWLFAGLSVSGVLFSREKLRRRYILGSGDPFDEKKHRKSLLRIRNHYMKRGYLGVQVEDVVIRKQKTKEVFVKIVVKKGSRFCVRDVGLTIKQPGHKKLEQSLKQYVRKAVLYKYYKGNRLKSIAHYIKHMLIVYGYPVAKVRVTTQAGQKNQVYLTFTVDIDLKNKIHITGNSYFSHKQLMEYITQDKRLLWHLSTSSLVQHIKEKYKKEGFLDIDVQVEQAVEGWKIDIYEGTRINVVEVEFVGVHAFSPDKLEPFFAILIKKDVVDDVMLSQAFDALIDCYVQQGYWDAEVERKTFIPLDKGLFKLVVQLDEGRQRRLKSIVFHEIEGIDLYKQKLLASFSFPAQDNLAQDNLVQDNLVQDSLVQDSPVQGGPVPFNMKWLDEQKEQIEQELKNVGIIGSVYLTLQEDKDGSVLAWHSVLKEKDILFGKTIIKGRPSISQARILNELAYKEGEKWSSKKIEDTFRHLQELGIFESIHVYPLTWSDPKGNRPVVIDAVADSPLELDLRLGFSLGHNSWANTYKLGASCLYKNVSGNADTFCFDADATRFYRDVEARYKYPRIGGMALSFQGKIFNRQFDRLCFLGCKDRLYTTSSYGGSCNFHYQFYPVMFDFCLGFESIRLYNLFAPCACIIDFDPCLVNNREPFVFFEPQLTVEYVDNKLNPQAGFISRVFSKIMVPLSGNSMHYIRILAEQLFFIPIGLHFVGALRMRIGHIFTSSFKNLIPSERFYLGGPFSVRSYQQDYVPPLGFFKNNGSYNCVPIGSRTMFNLNGELRIPLTSKIGAVVFQDIGALLHEEKKHRYLVTATGFGLRYMTPLGPLRFDVGWKGKLVPFDYSIFSWYLTIGHAF